MSQLSGLESAEVLGDFDFSDEKIILKIARMIAERKPRTVFIIPMDRKYQARCSSYPVQISQQFLLRKEIGFKKIDLADGLYASALTIASTTTGEVVWQRREQNYEVYRAPESHT
jgi:hypothetical protein